MKDMKKFSEWVAEKESYVIDENILNAAINAVTGMMNKNNNNMVQQQSQQQTGPQANNQNQQTNFMDINRKINQDTNVRKNYQNLVRKLTQRGVNKPDDVAKHYLSIQSDGKNNQGRYVLS